MGDGISTMGPEEAAKQQVARPVGRHPETLELNGSVGMPAASVAEATKRLFKRQPCDTMIIFDWDDTLLCTSAINAAQWTEAQLLQLEAAVEEILNVAMGLGETLIVTNGNSSWVEDSARNYVPGLLPTLARLKVISARAKYERAHPGNPFAWKRRAFRDVLAPWRGNGCCGPSLGGAGEPNSGDGNAGVNLVVLGDSPFEMEAAESVKETLATSSLVKTVKFKACPTATELLGQVRRVTQELVHIVDKADPTSKGLVQCSTGPRVAEPTSWQFDETEAWDSQLWYAKEEREARQATSDSSQFLGLPNWAQLLSERFLCKQPVTLTCQYEEVADVESIASETEEVYYMSGLKQMPVVPYTA